MLYLAWDREINISLFFCDVFVWKWGPRPQTSSRCYHGNKSAAPFKKSIFVHPPWAPNCMQNLKGGWKFSFPKMFDSYRDMFPIGLLLNVGARASVMFFWKILVFIFLMFGLSFAVVNSIKMIFVIKLRLHEGRCSPVVIWLCPWLSSICFNEISQNCHNLWNLSCRSF